MFHSRQRHEDEEEDKFTVALLDCVVVFVCTYVKITATTTKTETRAP